MKRRPLMERVQDYVCQCDSLSWRPVFTTEQMKTILDHTDTVLPPWMRGTDRAREITWETVCGGTCSLYGVPFTIEDGQLVGRLKYEHLTDIPDQLYGKESGSSYQRQGLALSKHFRDWPEPLL